MGDTKKRPEDKFINTGMVNKKIDKVSRAKDLLVRTPLNWKENMEWNFRVNSCDTLQQLATLCN
ncbi:MAG: hypothetical protein H8E74_11885 [Gammaproteobacteria bacterium]|nr:hypothetical protein [Gammaproteobacteria bacterium]